MRNQVQNKVHPKLLPVLDNLMEWRFGGKDSGN